MLQTKEQRLAQQRLCKRRRYNELKNDPQLLAIEKEKRRVQYLKRKEEGKVLKIKDKTLRSQRDQRKRWKENSRKYREKNKEVQNKEVHLEAILIARASTSKASEESDDNVEEQDPLQHGPECPAVKRAIRAIRYKELKNRKILLSIINALKKKNESQLKIIRILKEKLNLNLELQHKNIAKQPKVTQKSTTALFTTTFQTNRQSTIAKIIDFYCDDSNSTVAAGKKEYITRDKKRMQKRYLTAPLIDLYKKFKHTANCNIHYSFFCKNRPFWVLYPKPANRDTCMCSIHANMEMLVTAMNKSSILHEKRAADLLSTLCCDSFNTECLRRLCKTCKSRRLDYKEFNNYIDITFLEWTKVKKEVILANGTKKNQILTVKRKVTMKPVEAISKLEVELTKYLDHTSKIVNQYKVIKALKINLNVHEAIVHVDFSENYNLKYAQEVQSFHFGGSRQQVSIHTVVIYTHSFVTGQVCPTSMCTLSACLRHDAASIWDHLDPVLDEIMRLNPFVDTVHFLSDSPSSQYRNKYMFYIISQLTSSHSNITRITWNYSEAGHGKGAPDGVGATMKRTADLMVHFGTDIENFDNFYEILSTRIDNVIIKKVAEEEIIHKESLIPTQLKPFRGTLSVHQVLWDKFKSQMTMRNMSCFLCDVGEVCAHGKHLGYIKNCMPEIQNVTSDIDTVVPLANTKPETEKRNKIKIISNVLVDVTNKTKSTNAPMGNSN